jgi:exodeoxyribonuclease-3
VRITTWNVNSLKARLEKVEWWLERAAPDVLLMQETKLADDDAPALPFRMAGYDLLHHGEGRWNGVAIASRVGITDVVANFGDGPVRASGPGTAAPSEEDFDPLGEARMVSAVCGGVRVVSVYAPNGRVVDSPWYEGKLRWFERLARWLGEAQDPASPLVLGGDFNVAPTDDDVWDAAAAHGGTHVSERERAAFRSLLAWGLTDTWRAANPGLRRFTWWDYRAGNFQRNEGMRIDHLLATRPAAARVVAVEVDREARKGTPTPSDHAPLVLDLDAPGKPFDAGWRGSEERFATRRAAHRG